MYTYSTYASPTSYSNSYLSNGKTYQPLYTYYKAPNYYNSAGYYSTTFLVVYYDGYGYNFYYDTYGYYEYSVHPEDSSMGVGGIIGLILIFGCLGFFFCIIAKE